MCIYYYPMADLMKLFAAVFFSLFFCFNSLGQINMPLTINSKQLSEATRASFLDPHNHIGGILPPLALVDLAKFIGAEQPTTAQLWSFWNVLTAAFYETPSVKDNRRMSNAAKMVMICDQPTSMCANSLDNECDTLLRRNIANVLTASPVTTFWTAYAFRDMANASYVYKGKRGEDLEHAKNLFAQANLLELAKKNVSLVEMSVNFIGGAKANTGEIFARYKGIINDLNAPNTSNKNITLKNALISKGLRVPQMKWLLMTHTMELGKLPDDTTLNYAALGQCQEINFPEALTTDPVMGGVFDWLLKINDIVGVDVAGAESTCFTDEGMNVFKNLAKTVYYAAKERHRRDNVDNKLLVRVHVGEGAPVLEMPLYEERDQACQAIENFPVVKTALDTSGYRDRTNRPIHRIEATKNIDYLLNAIEELKEQFLDIDKFIIFRLGHLTHLTKELAQKAKQIGVHADVNLSSNISTSASTIDNSIIQQYFIDKGIKANHTDGLIATLLKQRVPIQKILLDHGLKWLLYYHIPTLLGSDGSGLENSASMNQEYFFARKLIEYWNNTDTDFRKRNISIDDLLYNQQLHYDAMGYGGKNMPPSD